jgi:hypothetical protein
VDTACLDQHVSNKDVMKYEPPTTKVTGISFVIYK